MNYNSIIKDLIMNGNNYITDKKIPLNNNKPIFSKTDRKNVFIGTSDLNTKIMNFIYIKVNVVKYRMLNQSIY